MLLGLAFVLPLLEAPKNILWLLFVIAWIANRARSGDWGGKWSTWDSLIAALAASAYLSAAFAGIEAQEWSGTNDILRYASTLFLVRRGNYSPELMRRLLLCAVAGTAVTLLWGYWGVYGSRTHGMLGLKSVGQVNHSAIYMAVVFGACIAWLRSHWRSLGSGWRVAWALLTSWLFVSIALTQSRAAFGVAVLFPVLYLLGVSRLRGRSVWPIVVTAVILLGALAAANPAVIKRHLTFAEKGIVLTHRDRIWHTSLIAWRAYPLFGVGLSNYSLIDPARVERWSREQAVPFTADHLGFSSHAHNLYINTLVERCIVCLVALLALLAWWAMELVRRRPRIGATTLEWALWGGAASAWFVGVTVGVVNTTLHHEHALLSMLLLGAWLSQRPPLHG